jgi:hypothetical protein
MGRGTIVVGAASASATSSLAACRVGVGVPASSSSLITRATSPRVEEDSSETTLPIFQKALSNFLDGATNTFSRTLDLDDTLGGLGEHILGRDHTGSGGILDGLDLQTRAADDGAHQVVRDQETE